MPTHVTWAQYEAELFRIKDLTLKLIEQACSLSPTTKEGVQMFTKLQSLSTEFNKHGIYVDDSSDEVKVSESLLSSPSDDGGVEDTSSSDPIDIADEK